MLWPWAEPSTLKEMLQMSVKMEEIVALAKHRGFIFQVQKSTAALPTHGTMVRSAWNLKTTSKKLGGKSSFRSLRITSVSTRRS